MFSARAVARLWRVWAAGGLKISIKQPKRCDVLIVYSSMADFLKKHIVRDLQVKVQVWEPYHFFVRPRILIFLGFQVLLLLFNKKLSLNVIKDRYLDFVVKECSPKIVLTWIDNAEVFGQLSSRHPKIKFCAIQNGTRPNFQVREFLHANRYGVLYRCPKLFCVGHDEVDRYKKIGVKVDQYQPCGSIRTGVYISTKSKISSEKVFELAFIGQRDETDSDFLHDRYREILTALQKYAVCKKGRIRVTVFGRYSSKQAIEEERYYSQYLEDYVFVPSERFNNDWLHINKMIDKTNLTVLYNSSVASEMMVLGSKVLYTDFVRDHFLEHIKDGPWIYRGNQLDDYFDKIDWLRSLSVDEWKGLTADYARYINNVSENYLPQDQIHDEIVTALSA